VKKVFVVSELVHYIGAEEPDLGRSFLVRAESRADVFMRLPGVGLLPPERCWKIHDSTERRLVRLSRVTAHASLLVRARGLEPRAPK
jgi:hypothetical protein